MQNGSPGTQATHLHSAPPAHAKIARLDQLLDTIDWNEYRASVLRAVKDAVGAYRALFSLRSTEKVYQIALDTYPELLVTAVSFETRPHVQESLRLRVQTQMMADTAVSRAGIAALDHNPLPGEFKYAEFFKTYHPELRVLGDLDLWNTRHMRHVRARMARVLTDLINDNFTQSDFELLPREDTILIGVCTPDAGFEVVRTM